MSSLLSTDRPTPAATHPGGHLPRATAHHDPLVRAIGWLMVDHGGWWRGTTTELLREMRDAGRDFGTAVARFGRRLAAARADIVACGLAIDQHSVQDGRVWVVTEPGRGGRRSDTVSRFVEAEMRAGGPDDTIDFAEIAERYIAACAAEGCEPLGTSALGRRLADILAGTPAVRVHRGRRIAYRGIAWVGKTEATSNPTIDEATDPRHRYRAEFPVPIPPGVLPALERALGVPQAAPPAYSPAWNTFDTEPQAAPIPRVVKGVIAVLAVGFLVATVATFFVTH